MSGNEAYDARLRHEAAIFKANGVADYATVTRNVLLAGEAATWERTLARWVASRPQARSACRRLTNGWHHWTANNVPPGTKVCRICQHWVSV